MDNAIEKAAADMARPKPLMRVFFMLYLLLAMVILIIFAIVVIISIVDVIRFIVKEAKQKKKFIMNQDIMIRDTTDSQLIVSYLSNDPEKEIYNIYSNVLLLNTIMILGGVIIIILMIQLMIFLIIKFLFRNSVLGVIEDMQPKKNDMLSMAIIVIVLIGVIVLNKFYTSKFLKRAQPELRDIRSTMQRVKNIIYSRMTTDTMFLAYLRQGNLGDLKNHLINKLKGRADEDAQRMIFTMNLYVFFYTQVPQTDKNYDTIMSMFNRTNILKRKLDISQYFTYNRSIYIPNYYPTIRDDLSPYLGNRERVFVSNVSNMMSTINRELNNLLRLPQSKQSVYSYMSAYSIIGLVFLAVLLTILFFGGAGEIILNMIMKIRIMFRK